MAPKRGATAYFVFCEEQRAATRDEVLAAAGEGAKVSVAVVAKVRADKWTDGHSPERRTD
jgi:hypothetical protein